MRKIFLPLLLVALSPVAHSEGVQEVEIDAPLSGWHPAEGEDASFSQSINYPASSVNMADDQNISAQIRGKIKNYAAAGKVQQGRLVVNGASMPQRIESDGSFARPYIFTEGSNSVQVISPDGQSRQKMQFYSTPGAGAIRARLRLVLSWDTDNTDLDLHVVTPDGEHAWYGNSVLKNSGALDRYGCHDGVRPRDFRHASADSRTLSGVYQLLWRTQRNGIDDRPTDADHRGRIGQ